MQGLKDLQDQEDQVIIERLREAAGHFVQAAEIQEGLAEPLIMLASIFLMMGDQGLVQKYLDQAEKLAPEHPALVHLKDYLLSAEGLQRMGQKRKAKPQGLVNAGAIQKVQSMLAGPPASGGRASGQFSRFFAEILPLLASARDLQDWVRDQFAYSLSDQDTLFVFEVMLGEERGDAKSTLLRLKEVLGAIQPDFGKQPSSFARELSRSPFGAVRHLHLLMRPHASRFAQAQQLAEALAAHFEKPLSAAEVQPLFEIMSTPPLHQPLQALAGVKTLLEKLQGAREPQNLTPVIAALEAYSP